MCLAIAYYFAEKKFRSLKAKSKISILCGHINIAEVNKSCILKALKNPAINDFEDGLEYYAALENKCNCIITEDIGDFYFSEIEVLRSEQFFEKYLKPSNHSV